MDQAQRERLGAASGIVAVVIIVISFIFGFGEPPGFGDSTEQVASFVSDNRSEIQFVTALTILAGVALIWFLGSLTQALRLAEGRGRPGRLAAIALAGGVVAYGFAGVGTAVQWAAAYHDALDAPVIQALWDSGQVMFGFSAGAGFAILVGASSVVALTAGGLPRSLGVYGAILAPYTVIVAFIAMFADGGAFSIMDGALPLIAFLGFLIWLLWASIALVRGAGAETAATGSAPPA